MSRGKHSSASTHRRMVAAEERVAILERENKALRRELDIQTRVAERVDVLDRQCRELRIQVELATCQQIEDLTAELAAVRERALDDVTFLMEHLGRIGRAAYVDGAYLSVEFLDELTHRFPGELIADHLYQVDDLPREDRRGYRAMRPLTRSQRAGLLQDSSRDMGFVEGVRFATGLDDAAAQEILRACRAALADKREGRS